MEPVTSELSIPELARRYSESCQRWYEEVVSSLVQGDRSSWRIRSNVK